MIRRLGLFQPNARGHWTVRAIALSAVIAGTGFVIGRGGILVSHDWSASASLASPEPKSLLSDAQSSSCLSWAKRIAASSDEVLEEEALRFLTVAAMLDFDVELEPGVARLRSLAQQRLFEGLPYLDELLERFFGTTRNLQGGSSPRTVLSADDLLLIRACRLWADSPTQELLKHSMPFLYIFHIADPKDEVLLHGLRRLCDYAIKNGGETGRELAREILEVFSTVRPPPMLLKYLNPLEFRAR
jgi:hypothetical protein